MTASPAPLTPLAPLAPAEEGDPQTCDIAIIGSGPAGHQAALQARRHGKSVIIIERDRNLGGACVHHGTIPSKTLRETALSIQSFPLRTANAFPLRTRSRNANCELDAAQRASARCSFSRA